MSPGRTEADERVRVESREANACHGDIEAISLAALDDLGISGGDPHSGPPGGCCHRLDFPAEDGGLQSLLDNECTGERERGGPGDRQIVHRAVDRQFADGTARKDQRTHDEGVGRQGQLHPADGEQCRIGERGQRRIVQGGQEQPFDQLVGGFAACPVAHIDPFRREGRYPTTQGRNRGDGAQFGLFIGDHFPAPTFSRSCPLRPKLK